MIRVTIPVFENIAIPYYRWSRTQSDKVWLGSNFRVKLLKMGIDKAGSINKLGRVMGYKSRVHPGWSVRQMLIGKQPFPKDRLKMLAEFLDYPIEEIMNHQISPSLITMENTRKALETNDMLSFMPR